MTTEKKEDGYHVFRHMQFSFLILAGLMFLIASVPAFGQVATGSLSGTVFDSTGAVVPNAEIVLQNEATDVVRQTISNGVGYFNFVAVQPGSYKVTISAQGFKSWIQKNIVFNQAENRTFPDITLTPGARTEAIEVSADITAVPVDTPESRMTLNTQMITDLAIQGRNVSELIKVMPGMGLNRGLNNAAWDSLTTQTNSGPIGQYSASGTQPYGAMTMTSDGASILDIGNMGTQVANINQDQTAEVTLLNSTFGAEFAKGPVTFQAISKSGEKTFHGSAYLYGRHSVFNSEDAYLKSQGIAKPEDSYYYPGFTLGGPVIIPGTGFNKNRDKLFFFTGYEYMKQTPAGILYQSVVPTPAMLSGDFSGMGVFAGDTHRIPCDASLSGNWWYGAYCGSGGSAQFVNGVYQGTLDPNSLALATLMPPANQDPATHNGYNYSILDSTPVNRWEYKLKVDYNISQKTHLSGSYTRQSEGNTNRFGVWWWPSGTIPYPTTLTATTLSRILSANLTHTFSPTMTNELVFAYSFFTFPPKFSNASAVDPANVAGYTDSRIWSPKILPQIPNLVSWSCNTGGTGGCFPHIYAPSMANSFNGGGFGNRKSVPSIADNIAKVLGSHTLKAGFYFDMSAQAQTSGYGLWAQGMYTFDNWTGNSTGNYLADFLIGHGQYQQTQEVPVVDVRFRTFSFYGQDQWKLTRRLTVTYGLRFDHLGQWYPTGDHPGFAVWDASTYDNSPTAEPYSGMTWHARNSSIPISGWESRWSYSPRVGAAYDLFGTGRTVLRGGFGIYPWQVTTNDIGGVYGVPLGFRTVSTGVSHLTDVNNFTPGALGAFNGDSSFALKKGDNKIPYTQNWNFIVSQRMPWSSTLEVQYAGNRTRDALLTGNGTNPNFIASINKIPMGALFGPDPVTGDPCPSNAAAGLTCDPDKWSSSQLQHFRPYQNYGNALIEVTHGSYSNYHALMLNWQKQTGRVTFATNYTFSKLLGIRDGQTNNGNGNGTNLDPFNIRNNYGVLNYDHTHIFNASYIFNLPNFIHDNAFLKGALNGWEISGITQWQSGPPLQGNTYGNLHASLPVSSKRILGTDMTSGTSNLMPYLTCNPNSGLSSGQYFNPNCFAVPTQVGVNGPYVWPYIKGPAFVNSDLSVYKTFKITERHNVQFRFSAFNFLNHPLSQFEKTDDTTMRFERVPGQPDNLPLDQVQYTQTNTHFTGKPAFEVGRRVFEFALKYTF